MGSVRVPKRGVTSLRRVVTAALIGLVATVAATGVGTRLAPLFDAQAFSIRGGSMEPAVPLGALVLVSTDADRIATGDVVTFRQPNGTFMTHRVAAIVDQDGERYLQTRGDANSEPDALLVPGGWVIGKVVVVVPFIGYLSFMLAEPMGILAVLSAFATLVLLVRLLEDWEWRMSSGAASIRRDAASRRSAWLAARLLAAYTALGRQRS